MAPSSACRHRPGSSRGARPVLRTPAGEKQNRGRASHFLGLRFVDDGGASCFLFAPAGRTCPKGADEGARSISDERLERQAKGR